MAPRPTAGAGASSDRLAKHPGHPVVCWRKAEPPSRPRRLSPPGRRIARLPLRRAPGALQAHSWLLGDDRKPLSVQTGRPPSQDPRYAGDGPRSPPARPPVRTAPFQILSRWPQTQPIRHREPPAALLPPSAPPRTSSFVSQTACSAAPMLRLHFWASPPP